MTWRIYKRECHPRDSTSCGTTRLRRLRNVFSSFDSKSCDGTTDKNERSTRVLVDYRDTHGSRLRINYLEDV